MINKTTIQDKKTNGTLSASEFNELNNTLNSSIDKINDLDLTIQNLNIVGEKGDKGDKGDTGPAGEVIYVGEKGDKGDTGPIGPQGIQGIQGIQGLTGSQGIQGIKGDKGDTGLQGIKGDTGEKGDIGERGLTGSTGATSGTSLFPVVGKKLLVLGDSLSAAQSGTMDEPAVGSWIEYTKNYLNLSDDSRVIAIGGAIFSDYYDTELKVTKEDSTGSSNVLSNQVYTVLDHYERTSGTVDEFIPDIIVLMFGGNNLSTLTTGSAFSPHPIGDFDSIMFDIPLTPDDFKIPDITTQDGLNKYNELKLLRGSIIGGCKWAMETLIDTFPNATIYLMVPTHRGFGIARGKYLFDLYPYLQKLARFYSCHLIDLMAEAGTSYYTNSKNGNGWDSNWYTYDGTHPNEIGQELIGKCVAVGINYTYFPKPDLFSMVNREIIVVPTYTINYSSSEGVNGTFGTLSKYGDITVNEGASSSVTITPNSGYQIDTILVDGNIVSNSSTISFVNVISNHTVLVTFSELPAQTYAPVFTSMIFSEGVDTYDTSATINLVASNTPTHYKIGESDSIMNNSTWIVYNPSINVSLTIGVNSFYIKLKNDIGESSTLNSSIERLRILTPPVLSSISFIGSGTVYDDNETITIYATNTPTHYKIGTTSQLMEASNWITFSNSIPYTLSVGLNTVYIKVKNADGESSVLSTSITYSTDTPLIYKADIAIGQSYTATPFDSLTGVYTAYAIGTVKNIYDNTNTLIGKILSSGLAAYNVTYIGGITGDDSGVYLDKYLSRNNVINGIGEGTITLTLTAGTYRISTLSNISSTASGIASAASNLQSYVTISGVTKNGTKVIDNFDSFITFDNISTVDGIIVITIGSNASSKRASINLIRIEKLSDSI